MFFDGATRLTDTHAAVQAHAGKATLFNKFIPTVEDYGKLFVEAQLLLLHNFGSCCAILGDYTTYMEANSRHSLICSLYRWPTHSEQICLCT